MEPRRQCFLTSVLGRSNFSVREGPHQCESRVVACGKGESPSPPFFEEHSGLPQIEIGNWFCEANMKKVIGYLSAAFLLSLLAPAQAQENSAEAATPRTAEVTVETVEPFLTRPLREIPPKTEEVSPRGDKYLIPNVVNPFPPLVATEPDTARQTTYGPGVTAPTPTGTTFDGVGVGLAGFVPSSNPPDTNGHIGATQYVQWNNTSFAVFSKAGALLYGPALGNTLWTGTGTQCETHNDGDPVVSYDLLAGRWILSQFLVGGSPNASQQCVAVSQTSDATGAWYLYDFVTDATNFVDYPKTATWPDGYYMTGHVFNAA